MVARDAECTEMLVGFLALMKGYSNREVGRELGMTAATVRRHLRHMFDRLNVRTRAQALTLAQEHGASSGAGRHKPAP
jgi:DNA-binding NarL/FixJ family response regulator